MEIKELGHVVLFVHSVPRSKHFYGDILGFKEIGPSYRGNKAAAFNSGGRTHHELLLIEVGEEAADIPAGRRVGMYHFGLKVGTTDDELREVLAHLQESGVRIVGASDHTVTHSLYVLDPDGNELELYIDVQPEIYHEHPEAVLAPTKPLML